MFLSCQWKSLSNLIKVNKEKLNESKNPLSVFTLLSACDVAKDRIMLLLPDNQERERIRENFLLKEI